MSSCSSGPSSPFFSAEFPGRAISQNFQLKVGFTLPYMWEENLKSMVLVSVCFCNKLPHSGLKQHIFIALEFCRSMFNRISLLELRFQQGHITSEALVENPVFYIKFFFQTICIPWLIAPLHPSSDQQCCTSITIIQSHTSLESEPRKSASIGLAKRFLLFFL